MDIASAEMVKYASNAMLATKISFINEIANLCEAYGSDIEEVRRGMCADVRIGNKFLYPGLGYGGSCFPKDVLACIGMGKESDTPTPLMQAVHHVNQRQRSEFMGKILEHFGEDGLAKARIAVWGIAFKPGTDDIREAPAISLMQQMLECGASIIATDPVAHETCYQVLGDQIEYTEEPYAALDGADAVLVCTDWPEFKHPDFDEMHQRLRQRVIFDGRNLYRPQAVAEQGFTYYSVGRRPMLGSETSAEAAR
jgi:UDPglucose 6-dehydrogenase